MTRADVDRRSAHDRTPVGLVVEPQALAGHGCQSGGEAEHQSGRPRPLPPGDAADPDLH